MVSIDAIWLFLISSDGLPATLLLPITPHPDGNACGIGYANNNHPKAMQIQQLIHS